MKAQLAVSLFLCSCVLAPASLAQAPGPDAGRIAQMEQILKEAVELEAIKEIPQKLAPLLAELRELHRKGALTPAIATIFQDALLLQMRTQTKLLASEQEVLTSLRELLTLNPKLDESIFNPREKLLLEKVRSMETGRLSIQTKPPGAVVSYMGTDLGSTPIDMPLIAGTYRLVLRKEGYLNQDLEVTILPSELLNTERTMRRRVVDVPLSVNAQGVTVHLNGQAVGVTQPYKSFIASLPAETQQQVVTTVSQWGVDPGSASFFRLAEVPTGEAMTLELRAPCYEPFKTSFTVTEQEVDWNQPIVVRSELRRVELRKEVGFMEVTSVPADAEIWLDGASLGKTPLGKDVCVGAHRLQLLHRSGQYVQQVIIRRGQVTKVSGEIQPAMVFLGIYVRSPESGSLSPLSAEWATVARTISLRSQAFADPQLGVEEIESLRNKGALPLDRLLAVSANPAETDFLVKKIAEDTGRVDLLLAGLRVGSKYIFQLYSTIHPTPDLIEVSDLGEASIDYLLSELNKALRVGTRLSTLCVGIDLVDSAKGLVALKVSPSAATGKTPLVPGAVVRTVDQKSLNTNELRIYLASKRPGETVTFEVATTKDASAIVPAPVRAVGAEYPWGSPDGFFNSVLTMLRHLIERDPLSEEAKYAGLALARGLMSQGEWKQALELLAKTSLEPHKSGVCPGTLLYYQGRCYEELGDRSQAESYYARAKDYPEATIGTIDGMLVSILAERRIQSLRRTSR